MSAEHLKEKVHELEKKTIKLELVQHQHSERQDKFEEVVVKHMESEEVRWSAIESHMKKMNRLLAYGSGVITTVVVLWAVAKDVLRILS